mgnify:CR=1 FL=1
MAYGLVCSRISLVLFTLYLLVTFYRSEANNAAYKKHVTASRTCGSPAEPYYPVDQQSVRPVRNRMLLTCNASYPRNASLPSYMVDENVTTFWQSTMSIDTANITIDLRGPHRKVK